MDKFLIAILLNKSELRALNPTFNNISVNMW